MFIDDEVKKCIVYLGCCPDNKFKPLGTGFLISVPLENNKRTSYVVTAKHVVENIYKQTATSPIIRFNLVDSGSSPLTCEYDRWVFHENPNVDLAIASLGLLPEFDHRTFPSDRFLDIGSLQINNLGIGSDVFLAGLFRNHYGKQKNIPIIRTGSNSLSTRRTY